MKKMLLVFVLLLSISAFSQSVYVDTLANGSDTLFVQNMWGTGNFPSFTVKNLSATACTLGVYGGYFVKNSSGEVYDTTWYQPPLKDSTFAGTTTFIVGAGIGKTNSVMLIKERFHLVKAWIKNTTGGNVQVILETN